MAVFKALEGHHTIQARRSVLLDDYYLLDVEVRDEISDGNTELTFSNGTVLQFYSDNSQLSVAVELTSLRDGPDYYKLMDFSSNSFWRPRLNRPIIAINILISEFADDWYRSEFGVEFLLEGDQRVIVAYFSGGNVPESTHVTGDVLDTSNFFVRKCVFGNTATQL